MNKQLKNMYTSNTCSHESINLSYARAAKLLKWTTAGASAGGKAINSCGEQQADEEAKHHFPRISIFLRNIAKFQIPELELHLQARILIS